ncbi:hypothetical protein CEXT_19461 [Caerostris extrusa]|uniref:Uncharacterized protein n=1 Tax=Caerostris extrusa TaxID=172846 RepID=A0AAV4Y5P6_CAEEX|nr:hypothetical protein CEXT_19461 [Caerostris extrusa]
MDVKMEEKSRIIGERMYYNAVKYNPHTISTVQCLYQRGVFSRDGGGIIFRLVRQTIKVEESASSRKAKKELIDLLGLPFRITLARAIKGDRCDAMRFYPFYCVKYRE